MLKPQKFSQLINRRETLADKAGANLKFENAIDRQLSELLSVENPNLMIGWLPLKPYRLW